MREIVDRLLGRAKREPVPLVLYSRPGCHLCEVMKAELARARLSRPYRLEERDIDRDPELQRRFQLSIPVLEIGGRVAFKLKLDRRELERKFERLAAEWESGRGAETALPEAEERG